MPLAKWRLMEHLSSLTEKMRAIEQRDEMPIFLQLVGKNPGSDGLLNALGEASAQHANKPRLIRVLKAAVAAASTTDYPDSASGS